MIKNPLKYTCLFGGGAIRGIAHVGALRAMEKVGIVSDTYAGSSVGSIVAALVCVGYDADEIEDIFLKVNFNLFMDIQFGIKQQFAISKGEVFLEWMRELIEKKYYGDSYVKGENPPVTFKDLNKNAVIITTDLSNFECQEFSKFVTPDFEVAKAVRISSSMPGLMCPIEYENSILVDGDLQKSWPMWKLSPNLCPPDERILEFRLEGDFEGTDFNPIEYLNAVYSCMTAMGTSFITEIYGACDKFDYCTINTGDVNIVDFNQSKDKRLHLSQLGYEQAMHYFKEILPQKKIKIFGYYNDIYTNLLKVKSFILKDKLLNAKCAYAEIFVNLCDVVNFIDRNDYSQIKSFNDTLSASIVYPALFGKIKLNNKEKVLNCLDGLIKNISEKMDELKAYLTLIKKTDIVNIA